MNNDDCSICLENIYIRPSYHKVCCGKSFHRFCYDKLHNYNKKDNKLTACPLCRTIINSSDEEQIILMKKQAENGNVSAQVCLGDEYYIANDIANSIKWYEIAANSDNALAIHQLGVYYMNGVGVIKSESKAIELVKKSAALGYPTSLYYLAGYYRNIGNHKKAFELYKAASDKNHIDAIYDLMICYKNGIGCEKSEEDVKCLKKIILHHCNDLVKTKINTRYNKFASSYERMTTWLKINEIEDKSISTPINMFWYQKVFDCHESNDNAHCQHIKKIYLKAKKIYDNHCISCGIKDNLKQCSRCKIVKYCSKDCQIKSWKTHKDDCDNVKMSMDLFY